MTQVSIKSNVPADDHGPLFSLLTNLCRDPSDAVLLSQLRSASVRADLRWYLDHEDATCREALTAAFARRSLPEFWLTKLAVAQVRLTHRLDRERPVDAALLSALAADALCLSTLSESLNTVINFEKECIGIRRACLSGLPIESDVQPLLAAIAMQAWHNEYVWEETAEETRELAGLKASIEAVIEADDLVGATLPLLRWAMYRALVHVSVAESLAAHPLSAVPLVLRPLWRHTLLVPREEAAMRATIPTVERITDPLSCAVRSQYEENPYPRWLSLVGQRRPVLEENRANDPAFAWPATYRDPLQILIAGCGTGEHSLKVALANPDAEVLALDLSRASLAYAQRRARELGIDNIRFVQGDILHLPEWTRRFHHVECSGVLHHLRDQRTAWQSVTAVVCPGGTLRVGVYSQLARLPVARVRTRIKRERVPPTAAGVRAFRARLMCEPRSAAIMAQLVGRDFFAMSGVRDLLFHVHEHPYRLVELEQHATACGLELLGYDLSPRLRGQAAPSTGRPTFAKWRTLEQLYTDSQELFSCTLRRPVGS